jgi:class 3 adenylate cyclase
MLSLEGDRREMTFLFTDVAGFTTLSEQIGTQEVARVLNAYLDGMCEVILRFDGTVDKFIGDAVFAIFNAPTEQPDHYERAVRCALALDAYTERFRAEQNAAGIPFGVTRIGINSGVATVGNFGSKTKMEYTALGDAVNTASRLEGLNKYFGTRISVSEVTQPHCPGISFRPLGNITLKGKLTGLKVFEPVPDPETDKAYLARYAAAYAALDRHDPETLALFTALHQERPEDGCVKMHLDRLLAGETGTDVHMHDK